MNVKKKLEEWLFENGYLFAIVAAGIFGIKQ
jgi:hypothetical protein